VLKMTNIAVKSALDVFRKKLQSYMGPIEIPDELVTQDEREDIIADVVGPQVTSTQLPCY
jgi:hypothetical protein